MFVCVYVCRCYIYVHAIVTSRWPLCAAAAPVIYVGQRHHVSTRSHTSLPTNQPLAHRAKAWNSGGAAAQMEWWRRRRRGAGTLITELNQLKD